MKYTVTKEHSTCTVKCEFEGKEWQEAQDRAYTKLGKDVTVKGFRKGAAPLEMVKKSVDFQKMLEKAYDDVLQKAYEEVMTKEKFDVVCRPDVQVDKVSDKEFGLTLIIPVKPDFTLGAYKDIEIKKEKAKVTAEEIQHQLEDLQQQNASVIAKPEGEGIKKGDVVRFDFEGFVDGKAFQGGKAENYELEIGSGAFIPGFEDSMIGLTKGYKGDLNVTFPEQYTPELAGKPAVFKINIKEISTKEIPELNDDLALDANIEGVSTLEELKAYIKKDIAKGKERALEEKAMNTLVDTIVDNTPMELPELLVNDDVEQQLNRFKQEIQQKGLSFDQYLQITGKTEEDLKNDSRGQIERNLKAMFILNEIAAIEKLEVTEEDIEQEFQNIANQYNMPVEKVKEVLKNQVQDLTGQIYSRKVTDFLRNNNKFVEGTAKKAAVKEAVEEAKPTPKKVAAKKPAAAKKINS